MKERDFQRAVLDLARLYGWRTCHFGSSVKMTKRGVVADKDAAGFPDLVLCRPPRLVIAELKVGYNKPTAKQLEWLHDLGDCKGVETFLWNGSEPGIMDEISRVLAGARASRTSMEYKIREGV